MSKYKIFAGLGGGFGGAKEIEIDEFETLDLAENCAYQRAIEKFESYGGMHGLPTWKEALDEATRWVERYDDDSDEDYEQALNDYAEEVYNENRESWLDWRAEEVIEED